jgi:hypothetical protein
MVSGRLFAASILVLVEDSSTHTLRAVRALAEKMLRLLDPHFRRDRIDLEPEDERAQEAMIANRWQGKDKKGMGHRLRVALARSIATKIMEPSGFVFFHTDADRRWSDRGMDPSLNIRRFHDELSIAVRKLIQDALAEADRPGEEEAIMSRLCLLSPYYSIEAWLYQNTDVARVLCQKHYGGRDVELFAQWAANRALLDDVTMPKEATCLKAKHNRELAETSFPAQAVYYAGASFTESVDRLMACAALCAALASSRAPG